MTFAKATVAVVALVIAFALGVWAGPSLTERAVVSKGRVATEVTERSREATARVLRLFGATHGLAAKRATSAKLAKRHSRRRRLQCRNT